MLNNAFNSIRISASGLAAERLRMDVISSNVANVNTTKTENGEAYRRKVAIFESNIDNTKVGSQKFKGIKAVEIKEDQSPNRIVYDPTHPECDENGYVEMSNVNILNEISDMIVATRAYEANIDTLNANKQMFSKALEIGK